MTAANPATAEGADATTTSLLRDPVFVVSLVIAVVVALGFGLVVPVLPLYARSFGVGITAATSVVSAFAGVRLVSNLYTGRLADRVGTRRAIGWGALIVGASSLAAAGAPNFPALLVLRGLGGFGSALFFNALLGQVILTVPGHLRGRAVGALQSAFQLGIAFGPGLGGLVAGPLGLRGPFLVYAGFCAASGAVALIFLPRTPQRASTAETAETAETDETAETAGALPAPRSSGLRGTWRTLVAFCSDRTFAAALLMMAATRWATTGVRFSLVPIFGAEVVGVSVTVLSIALVGAGLMQLLSMWPAGKIADTLGRKALSAPAYLGFAALVACFGFVTTPLWFVVMLTVYGVFTGLTAVTPPAIIGDIVPRDQVSTGVGVLSTAGDLGSVLGPVVSGLLAERAGFGWGFGATAGLLALAGAVAVGMRETAPVSTGRGR